MSIAYFRPRALNNCNYSFPLEITQGMLLLSYWFEQIGLHLYLFLQFVIQIRCLIQVLICCWVIIPDYIPADHHNLNGYKGFTSIEFQVSSPFQWNYNVWVAERNADLKIFWASAPYSNQVNHKLACVATCKQTCPTHQHIWKLQEHNSGMEILFYNSKSSPYCRGKHFLFHCPHGLHIPGGWFAQTWWDYTLLFNLYL